MGDRLVSDARCKQSSGRSSWNFSTGRRRPVSMPGSSVEGISQEEEFNSLPLSLFRCELRLKDIEMRGRADGRASDYLGNSISPLEYGRSS